MKVAFQQGLEGLADSLGQMGFEMIPLGQELETDAVLYQQGIEVALRARPSKRGALLLNVHGMSAAQTAQALRRRSNSQIF
jgi:4-hydroxyphenylpyruvate dioxygenase-like putative hemolysin